MNEFGEPNMGNPSVRFDEGRSDSAGLTTAVGSKPPPATSPTLPTNQSRVPKSVVNVIMRMKELYLEPRWGEIRNIMIDRSGGCMQSRHDAHHRPDA